MLTANSYGDTAMPFKVFSALRSRSTASCERRFRKQATSWRWPILAVVLGLFAHQEAFAQSALTDLRLTGSSSGPVLLDRVFVNTLVGGTFTADALNDDDYVTVEAPAIAGWSVSYAPRDASDVDGYQRNLSSGLTNRITVDVTQTAGSGTQRYIIDVTRTTAPTAPLDLEAASEDGAVTLSWTEPSLNGGQYIEYYQYRYKEKGEADSTYIGWVRIPSVVELGEDDSTTSYLVGGLVNGTTYIFQLRAWNANEDGQVSDTVEATPADRLPAPDVAGSIAGNRRVELSWTMPIVAAPISGYQYRQRVGAGSSWGGWSNIDDGHLVSSRSGANLNLSYTVVTSLTNGTEYRFQVRAVNSGCPVCTSAESGEFIATPMAVAPNAPRSLTAAAGDEQVTLSWTAPSDDGGERITRYEYQYRERPSDYPPDWTRTGGTQTTVTVRDLTNGKTYYFKVRAVNRLDW